MRLIILCALLLTGCVSNQAGLEPYQGEVLVLLMGKEDCPGTDKATEFLSQYNKKLPKGVAIARVDVPIPNQAFKEPDVWSAGFDYAVDHKRKLVKRFDFFYYPTLYILDRDQKVRYVGTCDEDRVPYVVEKLVAEKPGEKKVLYSPIMITKGDEARDFSGKSSDQKTLDFKNLRGKDGALLVFSSTTCPFSVRAVKGMKEICSQFKDRDMGYVIVNVGGPQKEFYDQAAPGVPVINDPDSKISKELYGIMGVPFMFLFDGKAKLVEKSPFTPEAANEALNAFFTGRVSQARVKARTGGG